MNVGRIMRRCDERGKSFYALLYNVSYKGPFTRRLVPLHAGMEGEHHEMRRPASRRNIPVARRLALPEHQVPALQV